MEKFSEILKQFNSKQRLLVLILLLFFSSGTYIVTNYIKADSCETVLKKNKELLDYIVQIQDMILIYKNPVANTDTTVRATKEVMLSAPVIQFNDNTSILDSILKVTEKAKNQ